MTYNITALQQATNVYTLLQYANDASLGILVGGFMIVIFFALLMMAKNVEISKRLLGAGFLCFGFSLLLRFANLMNFEFVILFLSITAFSGLYIVVTRRS